MKPPFSVLLSIPCSVEVARANPLDSWRDGVVQSVEEVRDDQARHWKVGTFADEEVFFRLRREIGLFEFGESLCAELSLVALEESV